MSHPHQSPGSDRPLLLAIAAILVVYVVLLLLGLPQKGMKAATQPHDSHHQEAEEPVDEAEHEESASSNAHPPYWMVTPFVLLLGAIAVLPLMPLTEHWWEHNRNRFLVAAGLGGLTLIYYLVWHEIPVAAHWPGSGDVPHNPDGLNFMSTAAVLGNAIMAEYIPFIMLLFSLYVISGGIRIEGDLPAHALTNSAFIAAGGVLASFIGTTGAAMLLIRPILETNRERKHVKHTVILFIFVVCNCGGCLLPIGDPPLFLGYLFGVPFLWTFKLWPAWLFVNVMLIVIYFLWDHYWYYPKETRRDIARDETRVRSLRFSGLWPNVILLVGVVLSVALLDPTKAIPGTGGLHPPLFLREVAQLILIVLSLMFGCKAARQANQFNYHAILEVAALFFGIFICMQAPLQILNARGADLGLESPAQFFWITGGLSAVLDNAPTYVVFFETAKALPAVEGVARVAGVPEHLLVAISLGAVFMGAMTYIGNGPNFMVKAIAEKSGVPMPSFFGYMLYSCLILLPLLVITSLIFF